MKKKNYSVQVYWTSSEHSMTGFYTTYRIQAEDERTAQNWALSKALKENNPYEYRILKCEEIIKYSGSIGRCEPYLELAHNG
jgi:hypothetical protein